MCFEVTNNKNFEKNTLFYNDNDVTNNRIVNKHVIVEKFIFPVIVTSILNM